ncbi:MAG: Mu-like prophage major head subunit gpT family protein [Planctomycetota bacterium]
MTATDYAPTTGASPFSFDHELAAARATFSVNPDVRREFRSPEVLAAWRANRHRCAAFGGADGELLSGGLSGLSFRNASGEFFLAMQERARAMWTQAVTTDVPSDQPFEIHKGLNGVPAMAKWAGERQRQALKELSLTVLNDKYESTITVDIDDLRRDKTGMIQRRIGEMGAKAATLPQRVFTQLIEANGNGYDGAAFFADTHLHGGTIDNNLAASASSAAAPTSAEMSTAILAAIQAMLGFQDDRADPINEDANSFAIVVPPKYWSAAIAAKNNGFTSAGVSNTLPNSGMSIDVFVNPRFTAANNMFYTFRTDVPQGALLWQEESIADGFKTLGADSSDGFWREKLAFGAKRVGAGALARFEFAARTTLS